jgi:hypothetical protein
VSGSGKSVLVFGPVLSRGLLPLEPPESLAMLADLKIEQRRPEPGLRSSPVEAGQAPLAASTGQEQVSN